MRALPAVRPLHEVMADIASWHGTEREFVESVMRDQSNALDIRLACADRLMRRAEAEAGKKGAEASLAPADRNARIAELLLKGLAHVTIESE